MEIYIMKKICILIYIAQHMDMTGPMVFFTRNVVAAPFFLMLDLAHQP